MNKAFDLCDQLKLDRQIKSPATTLYFMVNNKLPIISTSSNNDFPETLFWILSVNSTDFKLIKPT